MQAWRHTPPHICTVHHIFHSVMCAVFAFPHLHFNADCRKKNESRYPGISLGWPWSSRRCAFPLLHPDVLVCTSTGSLSVYRTSWVPAAAATASAGPPAAGDLEIEIVSCLNGHENRYTYGHEGARAPSIECGCGHAVGAYISLIADHRRLLIFSFFHCIHNAGFRIYMYSEV